MTDFLKQILQSKQTEVNSLKKRLLRMPKDVVKKLNNPVKAAKLHLLASELGKLPLTVIAEIKRCSPSKGFLAKIDDPAGLACRYALGGAKSISVLTESHYFQGSHADLRSVKKEINQSVPILRKDFIIDPIQLLESLFMGADIVLLIASVLKTRLREFIQKTKSMGLESIVEVHDEAELELAVESGAEIIGINNRNLTNFEISLDVAFGLIERIPHGIFTVAESGISHPSQARLCHQAGFSGVLIGEALVRTDNPERFIQACLGEAC
jgi:indole-3-glycerol phosphate synthase